MTLIVRPLQTEDYPQWRPLWDGYTHFYECYLDESVTAATGTGRSQIHHLCFAVSWRRTAASSASPCASCMKGPGQPRPFAIWKICLLTLPNVAQGRVKRLSTP